MAKDKECFKCEKFFECKGKDQGNMPCLHFKARKEKNEKGKNDR